MLYEHNRAGLPDDGPYVSLLSELPDIGRVPDVVLLGGWHEIRGLTMDESALDAMIDAGTTILGIEMKAEWRLAVRMHLANSLGHAATVLQTPLSDDLDPAPVFRA